MLRDRRSFKMGSAYLRHPVINKGALKYPKLKAMRQSVRTGEIFKYFQTQTPEASEKFSKVQISALIKSNPDL